MLYERELMAQSTSEPINGTGDSWSREVRDIRFVGDVRPESTQVFNGIPSLIEMGTPLVHAQPYPHAESTEPTRTFYLPSLDVTLGLKTVFLGASLAAPKDGQPAVQISDLLKGDLTGSDLPPLFVDALRDIAERVENLARRIQEIERDVAPNGWDIHVKRMADRGIGQISLTHDPAFDAHKYGKRDNLSIVRTGHEVFDPDYVMAEVVADPELGTPFLVGQLRANEVHGIDDFVRAGEGEASVFSHGFSPRTLPYNRPETGPVERTAATIVFAER